MAQVINARNQKIVASVLERADSFYGRLKGLLGRTELAAGHGLWLTATNSVHTYFMRFTIDVAFLDKNDVVCGLVSNLKPFRLVLPVFSARNCLELPAGTLVQTDTRKGDTLRVET